MRRDGLYQPRQLTGYRGHLRPWGRTPMRSYWASFRQWYLWRRLAIKDGTYDGP